MATRKRSTSSSSTDKKLKIVYIHGIGNKEAPDKLKSTWDKALFSQDVGAATRMAYWADLFHAEPLRPHDKGVRALENRIGRSVEPEALAPYGPEAEAFAAKLQAKLEGGIALESGATGRRRTRILPNPLRKPFTKFITEQFIRDVAAYFYDKETREEMQERLLDALVPERGPYLLISHSMGTVISYDVLHRLAKEGGNPVKHWVTIGSPLGLSEVKDHVHKPRTAPPGLETWRNYADRLDPIALDAALANDFKADGILEEELVENPDREFLRFWSAHSIRGYLSTSPIQKHIRDLVGPVTQVLAARQVVAKDVVAAMTDPRDRVEVLIELDEKINGATLAKKRATVVSRIREIAESSEAKIDELKHYVAASLSAREIDTLAAEHGDLGVFRVWRNSRKRALVASTARALQANTARSGYLAEGTGIAWAVLDTGVKPDHPHFKQHDNIRDHFDCTKAGKAPIKNQGVDRDGHGTHVCGIVAGEGTGKHGDKAGMAPKCGLYVYKVLDDDGFGNDSWIIKALDHIATMNEGAGRLVIHGVNLSLGGPFDSTVYACGFSPICKELYRLGRQGVVVCVAAGNEGQLAVETAEGEMDLQFDVSIGDPANLEEAIAVGSVHKEQPHRYGISYFSSRGPTADGRQKPDIVAPGERIVSANVDFENGDDYVEMSGTSMACPAISGLIASFLSVRKEFIGRPEDVKRLLMKHATDLGRDRYHQGAGMANLVRMFLET